MGWAGAELNSLANIRTHVADEECCAPYRLMPKRREAVNKTVLCFFRVVKKWATGFSQSSMWRLVEWKAGRRCFSQGSLQQRDTRKDVEQNHRGDQNAGHIKNGNNYWFILLNANFFHDRYIEFDHFFFFFLQHHIFRILI